MAGTLLGLVFVYALIRPYARARLTSFLDPWAHASSSGFQAVQGQIAIGSGGLFGVGPGESVQKIFYLPEAPTDFILAVIAEELGDHREDEVGGSLGQVEDLLHRLAGADAEQAARADRDLTLHGLKATGGGVRPGIQERG